MNWIAPILGAVLITTSIVLIFKARILVWTGRKSAVSSIKATFSDAITKEELGKYLRGPDARKASIFFRIGAVFLATGIWLLVTGAYVF